MIEPFQDLVQFGVSPDFQNIIHLKVLQQNVRNICGFHAYYNAKCMLRHFIRNEAVHENLNNRQSFWDEYVHMLSMLMNCKQSKYVADYEKQELSEDIETPLERGHLTYLLDNDYELNLLQAEALSLGKTLFFETIYYGFGAL